MVNRVWIFMIIVGFLAALFFGNLESTTQAALDGAKYSVELCIGLAGIYALWLGLMKVAEKSGLVEAISKKMKGIIMIIFPGIPSGHPAIGAITMNIIANMLGLGNAATPLGIKAMHELQRLNRSTEKATNDMCMFLIINTSSVQLIPTTVIALRTAAGSLNPSEIIGTSLIATLCSTITGILAAMVLRRYY
ncbi:MAG TPA: nucleoside recognition domain-containing protein [Clostridia bacterium]|nr:nucleoside recognition domain-containing protein [Clostridia bacterium]